MTPTMLILAGWAIVAVMMLALWVSERVRHDASIVDVGWAAGLGILGLFYAWQADGYLPRRVLAAGLIGAWSFRLAVYLAVNRVIGKHEDGRYQTIRANWGVKAHAFFFWFFQAQALLDVILSLCLVGLMFNQEPRFSPFEYAGVAIWIVSVLGETVADAQLSRFRRDPANRGRTCRAGLWRYSRHPNYFFEWLHWWTYVLMGVALPFGWLTLLGPGLMLFFILKVTGIPPTEARALETRGEDYRDYQRTTSAFVPWFPKKDAVT